MHEHGHDTGDSWAQTGRQPRIAIIGAGMSGIAAVIMLQRAGYTDLTVFEKADRIGGTWRENTYPGLSCDIPSRWYSYSFALKADWAHRYSYGPDILAYLESVASRFNVFECIRFNRAVTELRWAVPQKQAPQRQASQKQAPHGQAPHEKIPRWHLTTTAGDEGFFDVVISATGFLHRPAYPQIDSIDSFAGHCFHSARWDHSVELAGKRVGVIGTGSTAAQIVGAITDTVGEMHVFQRTPQWMTPLAQKAYSPRWNRLLARIPALQRLCYHFYLQVLVRTFAAATVGNKRMQRWISALCRRHLEQNVSDPALRAKLTPDYQAACKRLVVCSDFYPAISRPHAHLITDAIARIEPEGVVTVDGTLHKLDVLVLATGFDATAFILPTRVIGENGVELAERWNGSPRAHRAVAVPGFPNFWLLEGPTGPIGNFSITTISEHQIGYVIAMLDRMRRDGLASITARESAFAAYNAAMAEAVKDTVWWTGGCNSWYFDASGTPNIYPWIPTRYLSDMREPQFAEYDLRR